MHKVKLFSMALMLATLAACKTTKPLYYYGNYQSNVYEYFKAEDVSLEQQVQELNELVEVAGNKNMQVAPGVHAHLGYLKMTLGNVAEGLAHLNTEKQLYPESQQYIDFLISNLEANTQ